MGLNKSALLAAVFLAWAGQAAADERVVRKGKGCSDKGEGSAAKPWCSLRAAGRRARPGDRVRIKAGTYKERLVISVSGAKGKPIMFEGEPGKTVLEGKGIKLDDEGLIAMEKQAHVVLRGLTVKNSAFYAMKISGSTEIVIEKNKVQKTQHGGIVIDEGSAKIKVLGNDVSGTDSAGQEKGTHEAITLSNVTDFLVEGNEVHHGIKEGIDAKDGSTRGVIRQNHVHHMGQVGIYLNHATQVKIHDNKVHDGGTTGIQFSVGDYATGPKTTSKNEVYRNLVYNQKEAGIEFWQTKKGKMKGNRIYNNVVYGNGGAGFMIENVGGNLIHNNLVVRNRVGTEGNAVGKNTFSHNLFHANGGEVGSANAKGDPRFVDPKKADFRLRAGSPAIDAGKPFGLPFKGKAPDLGAFEHEGK
jgi:parallel beta-helix repeat protein